MSKTISATAAKSNFGAVVESVVEGGEQVIVENRGEPVAAIVSIADIADLERLRKEERRRQAIEEIKRIRAEVQAQNADLTEAEAQEFITRVIDDAMASLIAKGKIRFRE
jgi:prevent-host-death family protein